ncbi:unnamed protein product [Mytilus edulis]|uniref:Uncharacterized protein n=1 Tax=Mytilus edulis TaxID=6550 RepID=A0A8S3RFU5_MYTED|nr:unnamed protein product [Mytilus edulis]
MNQECVKSDYIRWTSNESGVLLQTISILGGHPMKECVVISHTISILGGHPMNQSVLSQTISILGGHPNESGVFKSDYQYIRWTSNESESSNGVLSQTISILGGHPMTVLSSVGGHPMNQECVRLSVLGRYRVYQISIRCHTIRLGGHPMNQECVKSDYQYIRWTSNESGVCGHPSQTISILGGHPMNQEVRLSVLGGTSNESVC